LANVAILDRAYILNQRLENPNGCTEQQKKTPVRQEYQEEILNKDDKKSIPSRPQIILHVGPPKTGTTSIQCGLSHIAEDLAVYDNYYFLGTPCPGRAGEEEIKANTGYDALKPLQTLYGPFLAAKKPPPEFLEELDLHYKLKHNLIISVEKFASIPDKEKIMDNIRSTFDPKKWDVRIIITYRRYFEWVPSQYFQDTVGGRQKGQDHIPSFQEFYLRRHNHWDSGAPVDGEMKFIQGDFNYHPTIKAFNTFESRFDVNIFNYHIEGDLLTNFVCYGIPDARATCEYLRKIPEHFHTRKTKNNESFIIAREAYDRGVLSDDKEERRQPVWVDVIRTEYMRITGDGEDKSVIPELCLLEKELHHLRAASLVVEQHVATKMNWGEEKSEINGKTIQQINTFNDDFDKYERMGKFCFMDLDKVFETPFWVELFDTIRRSDKEYLEKTYLNGRKTEVKK